MVRHANRAETVDACLKTPSIWPSINIYHLRRNTCALIHGDHRAQDFSYQLLQIGDGRRSYFVVENSRDAPRVVNGTRK